MARKFPLTNNLSKEMNQLEIIALKPFKMCKNDKYVF